LKVLMAPPSAAAGLLVLELPVVISRLSFRVG